MLAAISVLGRKSVLPIERISVRASFVTIYAHQAYILQCSLCFYSLEGPIRNFGKLGV
jgi:hypothetical protein